MNVDDLVKQAKQYLETGDTGSENDIGTPNVSGKISDNELSYSVGRLDILVASMWMLLQEKGFTDADLMTKITEIIEDRKGEVYQHTVIKCPKCGNNVQDIKKTPLTGRCYYCGEVFMVYPYNDKEDQTPVLVNTSNATVQNAATSEEAKEDTEKDAFEPYDVSKDLKFDEFE